MGGRIASLIMSTPRAAGRRSTRGGGVGSGVGAMVGVVILFTTVLSFVGDVESWNGDVAFCRAIHVPATVF